MCCWQGMTLLSLIIFLVVIGLVLWLINTFIPMDPKIKSIMNVVVVIFVVIWLVSALGLIGPMNQPIRIR